MTDSKKLNQAFKWFGEKNFKKADQVFLKLLEDPDTEEWVKNRIEQYQRIIEKHLDKKSTNSEPPTMADISAMMNAGNYPKAKKMIAETEIPEDAALFLQSEIALEEGDKKGASALLEKAIGLNKDNLGYARNSPSFKPFLNDTEFDFLAPN